MHLCPWLATAGRIVVLLPVKHSTDFFQRWLSDPGLQQVVQGVLVDDSGEQSHCPACLKQHPQQHALLWRWELQATALQAWYGWGIRVWLACLSPAAACLLTCPFCCPAAEAPHAYSTLGSFPWSEYAPYLEKDYAWNTAAGGRQLAPALSLLPAPVFLLTAEMAADAQQRALYNSKGVSKGPPLLVVSQLRPCLLCVIFWSSAACCADQKLCAVIRQTAQ